MGAEIGCRDGDGHAGGRAGKGGSFDRGEKGHISPSFLPSRPLQVGEPDEDDGDSDNHILFLTPYVSSRQLTLTPAFQICATVFIFTGSELIIGPDYESAAPGSNPGLSIRRAPHQCNCSFFLLE